MIKQARSMTLAGIKKNVRLPQFQELLKRYRIKRLAVFGSVATGKARPASDIDFLVEFEKSIDLLDMVAFKQDCEDLFGKKVDVVTPGGLSPYLKRTILREAKYL